MCVFFHNLLFAARPQLLFAARQQPLNVLNTRSKNLWSFQHVATAATEHDCSSWKKAKECRVATLQSTKVPNSFRVDAVSFVLNSNAQISPAIEISYQRSRCHRFKVYLNFCRVCANYYFSVPLFRNCDA